MPCPPPEDLPNPGIEPRSPTLQADSLPSEPPRVKSTVITLIIQLYFYSFMKDLIPLSKKSCFTENRLSLLESSFGVLRLWPLL